jgi:hypothetical protein
MAMSTNVKNYKAILSDNEKNMPECMDYRNNLYTSGKTVQTLSKLKGQQRFAAVLENTYTFFT